MAKRKATPKSPSPPVKSGPTTKASAAGLSEEEKLAVRERAKELREASRRESRGEKLDGEADVLAKIAEMTEPDRSLATRVHALVKDNAPMLAPKTWYGMPAYARDGTVVCFFQPGQKFKARYATLGFSDKANLDEGNVWPVVFALKELKAADEAHLVELLKKAVH